MSAYVIASINVTDPEQYKQYIALSPVAVARYGGRFLVRGGAKEVLEGEWPQPRIVVVEFESMEVARRFYDSPEYREARAARAGAAEFSAVLVEGFAG